MGLPQVAIVGRPNVGKSSLFNWLAGRRLAIVDPTAGVTRDRLTHLVEIGDRYVDLIDTGGMGIEDPDNLTEHIEEQIETAIDSAAVILLVVDARDGLVPLDEEVARRLRYVTAPVICVANKADTEGLDAQAEEFYRLGRKVLHVSVHQNRGKEELLEAIRERLPPAAAAELAVDEPLMRLAIVGRRNVGKSTFVNTLCQAERMIVSEVPGTTRDSVDVRFELDGRPFVAIDTPGFRRMKSVVTNIDFYGVHRGKRSIRRADVALLFLDANERVSKVDKQLSDYIAEQFKPCIFVVDKWDLVAGHMSTDRWVSYLRDTFRTMAYAPIAFIAGRTGQNVKALLDHAQKLFAQSRERVTTARLNRLVRAAIQRNPPAMHGRYEPKIYYATQVAVQPPTVVLLCNSPKAISKPYQRYLLGFLRDQLGFPEVPIKLYLRRRASGDQTDEIDGELRGGRG